MSDTNRPCVFVFFYRTKEARDRAIKAQKDSEEVTLFQTNPVFMKCVTSSSELANLHDVFRHSCYVLLHANEKGKLLEMLGMPYFSGTLAFRYLRPS
jgi:hypothetical protein